MSSEPDKTFDTAEMSAALSEAGSNAGSDCDKPVASEPPPIVPIEGAADRAREHGFAPPVAYDYDNYNATTKEQRDATLAEGRYIEPSWAATAARYEWDDDYGEVGPPMPELEQELFRQETVMRRGNAFQVLQYKIKQEGPVQIAPVRNFEDAGLHPVMLDNVTRLCQYEMTTPIQAYTIPAVLQGHDVVGIAQTGSGKTGAYLIPVLSRLMGKAKKLAAPRPSLATFNPDTDRVRAEPLVLVVCPARELAAQIFDEARRLCYRTQLRPCVIYGGGPPKTQRMELEKGCDVLIATPGRLCDFMDKPSLLSLNRVKYTIIDEADEMLDDDWEDELKKIMAGGDTNEDADHAYLMFSATFPKEARLLARQHLAEDYIRVRVGRAGSTHNNIAQKIIWVEDSAKDKALHDLLFSMPPGRTIVFVNSKRKADLVDDFLFNRGLPSTSIHADRTQREREDALRSFKVGTAPILVATGVTARGLDIKNVMHVINYDLPSTQYSGIREYVHRIGRTARIGNEGLATSFYNDRNEDLAEDLCKVLLEREQEIPDFLQDHAPAPGESIDFDDDTDEEEEATDAASNADGGASETNGDGFKPDGAFKADDAAATW
ncbi:putative dead deah box RNA helicase protein [Neofusicoccum parvum]|uniref:RNA helicase n=1 Tax=Botryosphaeria parva (strain UCR-NP2) TaxID=1287680 RepID=R1G3R0_BOTPV|nr:putative dead deah box rna helicase protein [Neofusicoccum parvum UCRNP2]GME65429.1 putative dead deah box RNA helicase protein [Neofusicoccum parvum]